MTYAYTVKTSEDGLIGVYGKKARAMEVASNYCDGVDIDRTVSLESTGKPFLWVYESGNVWAEVEIWYVQ